MNYKKVFGSSVLVHTSVREPHSHFISVVRFFSAAVGKADQMSNRELEARLVVVSQQNAWQNPLALDFGVRDIADVRWFIRKYVLSCTVRFVRVESLNADLASIARHIVGLAPRLPRIPSMNVHSNISEPFRPSSTTTKLIRHATHLDRCIYDAVAFVNENAFICDPDQRSVSVHVDFEQLANCTESDYFSGE